MTTLLLGRGRKGPVIGMGHIDFWGGWQSSVSPGWWLQGRLTIQVKRSRNYKIFHIRCKLSIGQDTKKKKERKKEKKRTSRDSNERFFTHTTKKRCQRNPAAKVSELEVAWKKFPWRLFILQIRKLRPRDSVSCKLYKARTSTRFNTQVSQSGAFPTTQTWLSLHFNSFSPPFPPVLLALSLPSSLPPASLSSSSSLPLSLLLSPRLPLPLSLPFISLLLSALPPSLLPLLDLADCGLSRSFLHVWC